MIKLMMMMIILDPVAGATRFLCQFCLRTKCFTHSPRAHTLNHPAGPEEMHWKLRQWSLTKNSYTESSRLRRTWNRGASYVQETGNREKLIGNYANEVSPRIHTLNQTVQSGISANLGIIWREIQRYHSPRAHTLQCTESSMRDRNLEIKDLPLK